MANQKHVEALQKGVENWNHWRFEKWILPDLSWADFSQADLRWANLSEANLGGANLGGANLNKAILHWANLEVADLSGANLTGAHLGEAILTRAHLDRAKFSETVLGNTVFADVDLSHAEELHTCQHLGPSTIGIDTIYRSKGNIPDEFLRGCGVPELFITYARSLVGQAIEFYSCFISYSSHDQAFAERLHADLRAKNLRCWFAPEDLKIGERFRERIQESIRVFDKVMIVLSEASVHSRWVEREVNAAREREERENRTVLFPIRIDDAVMDAPQPWAADIRRTRHIGDFRRWERPDAYQTVLERLLRDLRADAPTPPR
jgi:hypothetical protein